MRCRVLSLAVLFAFAGAGDAEPASDPFSAPVPAADGVAVSVGGAARYAEAFARLKAAWDGGKGPDAALERLAAHLERFDRLRDLVPVLGGETGQRSARLRGLFGRALVDEAYSIGGRAIGVVVLNGRRFRRFPPRLLPPRAKKLLGKAIGELRTALREFPDDPALRRALADALEGTDEDADAEARKLRVEAAAIEDRRLGPAVAPLSDRIREANRLAEEALAKETAAPPQHDEAERLRKRALVLAFCSHTIPFEYDPALWKPVSLLAPRDLLDLYLQRHYRIDEDRLGEVPPRVYPIPPEKREEVLEGLGLEASDAAAAALLGALRHADESAGRHVDTTVRTLAKADNARVRVHLPELLAFALFRETSGYSPVAQRALVDLAVALGVRKAAPVLRAALDRERDLHCPRGIAAALGRLGTAADADALFAVAADPARDVHFRREAVLAFARLAPDRLAELPDEPALALAVAAARHRLAPADETKGRLLAAIGTELETDEAARYCAGLGIVEARPALEEFLAAHEKHPAREVVQAALVELAEAK